MTNLAMNRFVSGCKRKAALALGHGLLLGAAVAQAAQEPGQEAGAESGLEEVIVTAQKRSESINKVPMSISALDGDQLTAMGIHNVSDLQRVIPGFNFTEAPTGAPVYTIRGMGYYETSLAAPPAVSVYIDEAPLPYSVMTRLGIFDLERVEVLKGPQGTLFGSNNTGGAINYIAAKPTDDLSAGVNLEVGSFESLRSDAYISGALADGFKARLAVQTVQGGEWQKSATRPNDELGEKNQWATRLLLDWAPTEDVSVNVNLSGWRDRSDTTAAQLLGFAVLSSSCAPGRATYPDSCIRPDIAATPTVRGDARKADWNAGQDFSRDDEFYLGSGRVDVNLSSDIQLTSLTSFSSYRQRYWLDQDGTSFNLRNLHADGKIESLFQELRLTGDGPLRWILGANYQRDDIDEQHNPVVLRDASVSASVSRTVRTLSINPYSNSETQVAGVFGNIDYDLATGLTARAGVRYTDSKIDNVSGSRDSGDGSWAAVGNLLELGLTGLPGSLQPGDDIVFSFVNDPTAPRGRRAIHGPVAGTLEENNLSWRIGLDYELTPGALLYGNVSRGFKAGSFPLNNASASIQYLPATQEEVTAYELGVKSSLLERTLQLNVAGFYYDYRDKQLRGRLIDPLGIFGALEALVNVPKSRVIGAELQATYQPVTGLTLTLGTTYLDTEVTENFSNYDPLGALVDFKGMRFPYTPEWSVTADIAYEWAVGADKKIFVGVSGMYQSSIVTAFADPAVVATIPSDPLNAPGSTVPGDSFRIPGYELVDLRMGVGDAGGQWSVGLWSRNVFDKDYLTNKFRGSDTISGYAGLPRTVGIFAQYKY